VIFHLLGQRRVCTASQPYAEHFLFVWRQWRIEGGLMGVNPHGLSKKIFTM